MELAKEIEKILRTQSDSNKRRQSFLSGLDQLEQMQERDFLILFAGASRRLGRNLPQLDASQKSLLQQHSPALDKESCGQLGRVLLTLKCPDPQWLKTLLLKGDDFEKAAILKTLANRPDAGDFLEDVVNTCRINSSDTYSAIAMNNPYPSLYFSDEQLTQLALKCLFLQLPFDQIYGLKQRYNQAFGESLVHLYQERTAAGRDFAPECLNFMKEMNLL